MTKEPSIKVVGKVSKILNVFLDTGPELTMQEIATASKLEMSTSYRLVNSLLDVGLLRYDPAQRTYSPGLPILELSRVVLQRFGFREVAHREMIALSRERGWTVYLAVLEETIPNHIVYIDVVSASPDRPERSQIGQVRPAHSTSTGKVLLAFSNIDVSAFELVRRTPKTITHPTRLQTALEEIRERGYAWVDGEEEPDIYGAAAPIFGRDGLPIAALGAHMNEPDADLEVELVGAITSIARGISSFVALGPVKTML